MDFDAKLIELRKQPWTKTSDGLAWGRMVLLANHSDHTTEEWFNLMMGAKMNDCFIDDASLLDPDYDPQQANDALYLIETTEEDPT